MEMRVIQSMIIFPFSTKKSTTIFPHIYFKLIKIKMKYKKEMCAPHGKEQYKNKP